MSRSNYIVSLSLRALDLKAFDAASTCNSCCKVFIRPTETSKWNEIINTELIDSNYNPRWSKTIKIHFSSEESQQLKIVVYDFFENNLEKIGKVLVPLQELAINGTSNFDILRYDEVQGQLIVTSEIRNLKDKFHIQVGCRHLANKDAFNYSDPYFILYRLQRGQEKLKVYKSEIIEKSLDPDWNPIKFNLYELCGEDIRAPLKIEVWDYNPLLSDVLMGEGYTSIYQLLDKKEIVLKRKNKIKGIVEIISVELIKI